MIEDLKVKMYPAKNGDSFFIKSFGGDGPVAILVDGGYGVTFNDFIKSDIDELDELDLVVASHVDADHILGLLEFFKHNDRADSANKVKIKKVWHNSLRSITGYLLDTEEQPEEIIKGIIKRGFPSLESNKLSEISAKQGSSLAARLASGNYNWNEGAGLTSINTCTTNRYYLNLNSSILVIGPTVERLNNLKFWWVKKLKQLGYFGSVEGSTFYDDAFEFMCADNKLQTSRPKRISHKSNRSELHQVYTKDDSVVNGSSISFIFQWNDKRLLFLADSMAEDIEEEIIKISQGEKLMFDCVKVSHHGSYKNTSPRLLELIDSKIFLISTNGDKHDHPDFTVLKAIVDRPADFERELYFNYSTQASKSLKKYSVKSEYCFKVHEEAVDWIRV